MSVYPKRPQTAATATSRAGSNLNTKKRIQSPHFTATTYRTVSRSRCETAMGHFEKNSEMKSTKYRFPIDPSLLKSARAQTEVNFDQIHHDALQDQFNQRKVRPKTALSANFQTPNAQRFQNMQGNRATKLQSGNIVRLDNVQSGNIDRLDNMKTDHTARFANINAGNTAAFDCMESTNVRERTPRYEPLRKLSPSSQCSVEIQTDAVREAATDFQRAPSAFDQSTQIDNDYFQRVARELHHQRRINNSTVLKTQLFYPYYASEQQGLRGTPTFRQGRNGSSWRHLRQCTGVLGNNIMFLDGSTKEHDCRMYPPHGLPSTSIVYTNVSENFLPHTILPGYRTCSLSASRRPSAFSGAYPGNSAMPVEYPGNSIQHQYLGNGIQGQCPINQGNLTSNYVPVSSHENDSYPTMNNNPTIVNQMPF